MSSPTPKPSDAQHASSGVRRAPDLVGVLAAKRGDSQRRRVRPLVLVIAGEDGDVDVIARGLQERYDLRFRDTIDAARAEMEHEMPDALVIDEEVEHPHGRELLARLAGELRSPVVIVLSTSDEPPLSRQFAVPSVKKPVDAARIAAALEVAREQWLRPVVRKATER